MRRFIAKDKVDKDEVVEVRQEGDKLCITSQAQRPNPQHLFLMAYIEDGEFVVIQRGLEERGLKFRLSV